MGRVQRKPDVLSANADSLPGGIIRGDVPETLVLQRAMPLLALSHRAAPANAEAAAVL